MNNIHALETGLWRARHIGGSASYKGLFTTLCSLAEEYYHSKDAKRARDCCVEADNLLCNQFIVVSEMNHPDTYSVSQLERIRELEKFSRQLSPISSRLGYNLQSSVINSSTDAQLDFIAGDDIFL